jgi:hypothetical protein
LSSWFPVPTHRGHLHYLHLLLRHMCPAIDAHTGCQGCVQGNVGSWAEENLWELGLVVTRRRRYSGHADGNEMKAACETQKLEVVPLRSLLRVWLAASANDVSLRLRWHTATTRPHRLIVAWCYGGSELQLLSSPGARQCWVHSWVCCSRSGFQRDASLQNFKPMSTEGWR